MIIKDRKKLITFDGNVLQALEAHSRRTGSSLRTILSEAARDEWLAGKGQPVGLKAALKASARARADEGVQKPNKTSRRKRGAKPETSDPKVAAHMRYYRENKIYTIVLLA